MSATQIRQRLAAILAADVAGYARLMADDERSTIAALDAARNVFREHIRANHGRVIDMAGDSVLAVFELASGAVAAALAIQKELDERAGAVPDDRRMRFRLGVHLGEIIEKDDGSIYGDGVNIAARLQALADPGNITVSESIRNAVRGKIAASFADLGEQSVKNLDQPVHVFSCAGEAARPPATPTPGEYRRRKQSIAVLAFDNMTGDPEQVHFCDGISEDIITDLSKIEGLAVIGRQSAFAYKGKANDLRRVGRELGVHYVLEGSVRKGGNRVRVTAQLVEAESGTHMWAHRYDRELDDVFLVGDDIARDIVEALDIRLAHGEEARIWRRAVKTVAGREAFMRGYDAYARSTPEGNRAAREMFLEVARLEPESPMGYAYAGVTHAVDVTQGWSNDIALSLSEARRLGTKAVELDEASAGGHWARAVAALFEGGFEEAMAEAKISLDVRPMCASPRAGLAYVQLYSGSYEHAISNARNAIELNPVYPGWYLYLMAAAQHFAGHEHEALTTLDQVLAASPRLSFARTLRIASLMALGRAAEAKADANQVLRERADFSVERIAATQPFRDAAQRQRFADALRAAGLP
ncbi:MAG TPA: adenylate/guanylate cyclase domain-containing protein [Burkholderiales bacterium]|nr:adenylate/guanylate cyclase domain-containing protein [Burkholderiales bacterium]